MANIYNVRGTRTFPERKIGLECLYNAQNAMNTATKEHRKILVLYCVRMFGCDGHIYIVYMGICVLKYVFEVLL